MELPGNVESTSLSWGNLSREIGRIAQHDTRVSRSPRAHPQPLWRAGGRAGARGVPEFADALDR